VGSGQNCPFRRLCHPSLRSEVVTFLIAITYYQQIPPLQAESQFRGLALFRELLRSAENGFKKRATPKRVALVGLANTNYFFVVFFFVP
jgi:hypothetical protein